MYFSLTGILQCACIYIVSQLQDVIFNSIKLQDIKIMKFSYSNLLNLMLKIVINKKANNNHTI